MKAVAASVLFLTASQWSVAAELAGDLSRGARVFQQCVACHSIEAGRNMTGPSLAHVWNRKAGTAEAFGRYSDALRASNIIWTQESLQRWLANPQAMVPGTSMTFAGIRDAKARDDVIAYLKAASEGKAPAGGGGTVGGGMMGGMMGSAEPADLRKAAADSQVASIHHCRDTYTVRTRDGKVHKIWEYNLRLKTDSSDHGPNLGAPVIVDSGMRGDRFSIVFASPAEVSRQIQESCQ
jgi:cytochrome c